MGADSGGAVTASAWPSDPNPRVSGESIFGLAWKIIFGWFPGGGQAEGPSVASGGGSPWGRGRMAWSGRCGQGADAGEDLVEQVVSRW